MRALICSLVLLAAGVGLGRAQHGHPTGGSPGKLTVGVGSATGAPGQEVDIPVTLTEANNLGALELVLTYDPAVLEAKSAERGSLLGGNALVEYYANPSGRLAVTLVCQDAVTGDGAVVRAHFLVKGGQGQKSALQLESVRAWDGKTHLDFLVTTAAGEFTVAGSWPWWWIAGGVGTVVLMLLLVLAAARRTRPAAAAASQREPEAGRSPCPRCRKLVEHGVAFCPHCGHKMATA